LIVTWETFVEPFASKSKKILYNIDELSHDVPFSGDFISLVGEDNASSVLDDEASRFGIMCGILEKEAFRQYDSETNQGLLNILHTRDSDFYIQYEVNNGVFTWNVNHGFNKGTGIVSLFKVIFNIPERDAVATLASILRVSYENVFSIFDVTHAAETNLARYTDDIPRNFQVLGFPPEKATAHLTELSNVYGHAGQIIGAFAEYHLDGNTVCLPATVGAGSLSMGRYKPAAFWLNHDKIDGNACAKILVFDDIRAAIKASRVFDEAKISPQEIIATAFIGNDLDVIPWEYLRGHEIIFICSPQKRSYSAVKDYRKHIMEAGAKSFKVYPYPVLHALTGKLLENGKHFTADRAETALLEKAEYLDQIERPSIFVAHILSAARSYEEYLAWARQIGLLKPVKVESETAIDPIFRPGGNQVSLPASLSEVHLGSIFPPGVTIFVHGSTDSGKSIWALTIIRGLVTGSGAFGFMSFTPMPCLLADSETVPASLFEGRLKQFGLLENGKPCVNFWPISIPGQTDGSPFDLFDLMQEGCRTKLLEYCRAKGIRFIFFDNLISLCKNGKLYSSNTPDFGKMCDWIKLCNKSGITVILMHHSHKEKIASRIAFASARGSQELSIRAFTEIKIIGQRDILECNSGIEVVDDYARQPGATIGLCFNKSKGAPILGAKILWYHLPQGASQWLNLGYSDSGKFGQPDTLLTKWAANDVDEDSGQEDTLLGRYAYQPDEEPDEDSDALSTDLELQTGLPDKEHKILEYIRSKGEVSKIETAKQFKKSSAWAEKGLKNLCDKGLTKRRMAGRKVYYSLA
jgi:hypothetical protein